MKTEIFLYKNIDFLTRKNSIIQKELSQKLGITKKNIENITKNKKNLFVENVIDIAGILNIDPISLLFKDISLTQKNGQIKFLVLDIDGVLTDGGMYYTEKGDEIKKFNTKDGLLIRRLIRKGFKVGFLSNGVSKKLVLNRAKLLEVNKVYVGTDEKSKILNIWLKELKFKKEEIAYIGDDLNDIHIFDMVGFTACPSDACLEIKQKADYILKNEGGKGCVREFIEKFLSEYN